MTFRVRIEPVGDDAPQELRLDILVRLARAAASDLALVLQSIDGSQEAGYFEIEPWESQRSAGLQAEARPRV